jgi:heme iron utilization protein
MACSNRKIALFSKAEAPSMAAFSSEDSSPEASKFDPVAEAKLLLRSTRSAALATLVPESGAPFATLVNVATSPDGSPILLLSQLAAHRRHLAADPRLSLLFYAPGHGDPLAHPRLTILGRAHRAGDAAQSAALRTRFLARNPQSALYADFPDFAFFHVEMENLHLNGGFGRAGSVTVDQIRTPIDGAAELIAVEAEALAHINTDHPEVAGFLAKAFGGACAGADAGAWRAVGLDPEGIDLGNNEAIVRVAFPQAVSTHGELRQTLVDLMAAARRNQGTP